MKTAKIDLHLHLDGSLNVHWMYEMSKKRGVIESETTFEQYYKDIYCTAYKTMEEAFRMFDRPIDVMQHGRGCCNRYGRRPGCNVHRW